MKDPGDGDLGCGHIPSPVGQAIRLPPRSRPVRLARRVSRQCGWRGSGPFGTLGQRSLS